MLIVQAHLNNNLDSLLEYYQNGRFSEAEKLAVYITQEFPKHQFAWKVLGAVLEQTGRKSEAVDANQTAVHYLLKMPKPTATWVTRSRTRQIRRS